MKFVTECKLTSGKSTTVTVPNLTKKLLIPSKITLNQTEGGKESPVKGILCRVNSKGAELAVCGEASFMLSNEIELNQSIVEKSGAASINITNRSTDHKNIKMYVEYSRSYGSVLMEEKIDHFENVLSEIHKKGFCTRVLVTFSKDVDAIEFASVAECVDEKDKWVEPFSVPMDKELDLEDRICNIDLTSNDLGPMYSDYLNFLEMRVTETKKDDNREPLYMYIIAYGYPW